MSLPPTSGPIRILAIDGGAMMGVIPARILSYLDGSSSVFDAGATTSSGGVAPVTGATALRDGITGTFDVVIGTSTGGLLAAGLTVPTLQPDGSQGTTPMLANDLLEFYLNQGQVIFGSQSAKYPNHGPRFTNAGLTGALTELYGSPGGTPYCTVSSSVVSELLITSFNNAREGALPYGPFLVDRNTSGPASGSLDVLTACLMTSAFPTLLPPIPWGSQGDYFIDGGVWAGNPSLAAYLWALAQGYTDIYILSVGCGVYAPPVAPSYADAAGYGVGTAGLDALTNEPISFNPIAGWMLTAREDSSDGYHTAFSELVAILASGAGMYNNASFNAILNAGRTRYVRIQPQMPNPGGANWHPAYDPSHAALDFWVQQADGAVSAMVTSGQWSAMVDAFDTPA